jgi:hypothetical protein
MSICVPTEFYAAFRTHVAENRAVDASAYNVKVSVGGGGGGRKDGVTQDDTTQESKLPIDTKTIREGDDKKHMSPSSSNLVSIDRRDRSVSLDTAEETKTYSTCSKSEENKKTAVPETKDTTNDSGKIRSDGGGGGDDSSTPAAVDEVTVTMARNQTRCVRAAMAAQTLGRKMLAQMAVYRSKPESAPLFDLGQLAACVPFDGQAVHMPYRTMCPELETTVRAMAEFTGTTPTANPLPPTSVAAEHNSFLLALPRPSWMAPSSSLAPFAGYGGRGCPFEGFDLEKHGFVFAGGAVCAQLLCAVPRDYDLMCTHKDDREKETAVRALLKHLDDTRNNFMCDPNFEYARAHTYKQRRISRLVVTRTRRCLTVVWEAEPDRTPSLSRPADNETGKQKTMKTPTKTIAKKKTITKKKKEATLSRGDRKRLRNVRPPVQIVLRRFANVAAVLYDFDIGAASVAYEHATRRYRFSLAGKFAFEHSCNVVDVRMHSPCYGDRLVRYSKRGFGILLPSVAAHVITRVGAFHVACGQIQLRRVSIVEAVRELTQLENGEQNNNPESEEIQQQDVTPQEEDGKDDKDVEDVEGKGDEDARGRKDAGEKGPETKEKVKIEDVEDSDIDAKVYEADGTTHVFDEVVPHDETTLEVGLATDENSNAEEPLEVVTYSAIGRVYRRSRVDEDGGEDVEDCGMYSDARISYDDLDSNNQVLRNFRNDALARTNGMFAHKPYKLDMPLEFAADHAQLAAALAFKCHAHKVDLKWLTAYFGPAAGSLLASAIVAALPEKINCVALAKGLVDTAPAPHVIPFRCDVTMRKPSVVTEREWHT